ncbi:LysR family transcriptional regulator [Streptomyces sp. NPDC052016]|uniref:LysR family transcriptional regulator n=1 Tax=Streptomyces sp. NPDC052016 TaxID=3365680 RepID=UPI0037D06C4A
MSGADVELRHLRAFAAVARHGSFSGAARELLITQPALSRTVAQLEAALGVRLLDRLPRHVRPTEAGAEFLAQAEEVLAAFDHALAVARRASVLRLGFSWLLPDPWAQEAIRRFEQTGGATVQLVRCDDPLRDLRLRAIDVALLRGTTTPPAPARAVPLYEESRIAVCAQDCELARLPHLNWADVPAWPLVVNTVSGTTGPWSWPVDQQPDRVIETTNFDEWLESVAANRGIGIVPEAARRRIHHPGLCFVPLVDAPLTPVALAYLPDTQPGLVRRFIAATTSAVATG